LPFYAVFTRNQRQQALNHRQGAMAPGSRHRQQQQNGQQQQQQQRQQQSSPAAATAQQAHQLLQRLATAPDLSLFRDKLDRVKQLALCSLPASEELLLLLAASVTNGLRQLQPLLLQLDLPKNASMSIHALLVTSARTLCC
jgi:hypothetical protein